jgi:predicted amidophosphoribosyltransferase
VIVLSITCDGCGAMGRKGTRTYAHILRHNLKADGWHSMPTGQDLCPACWRNFTAERPCPTCGHPHKPKPSEVIKAIEEEKR